MQRSLECGGPFVPFTAEEAEQVSQRGWAVTLQTLATTGADQLQNPTWLQTYIDDVINPLLNLGIEVYYLIEKSLQGGLTPHFRGIDPAHPTEREIPILGIPGYNENQWTWSATHTMATIPTAFSDYWFGETGLRYYPALWNDTPVSEYEYRFGECFDMLDATDISGYQYEHCFDNGIEWLRGKTNKTLRNQIINVNFMPATYTVCNINNTSLIRRAGYADTMVLEMYNDIEASLTALYTAMDTIRATYPGKSYGVTTFVGPTDIIPPGKTYLWWDSEDVPTQEAYCSSVLRQMVGYLGGMTNIETMYANDHLTYTPMYYMDFFDDMRLGDLCEWKLGSAGTPGMHISYTPASTCEFPPYDTFENTGNELIMLKSSGAGGAHTIDVGGVTYTVTLSPDRPTFLGTFPLKDFGGAPVIAYDNANIDVTVIKMD